MKPGESFLQQPVRSLQTMLRVIADDDDALPTVIPDGIYGQQTIQAVNAFQTKYNLPITGVTDQSTWEQIVKIYEGTLIRIDKAEPIEVIIDPGKVFRKGEQGPYIFLLQSILTQLSFDSQLIPRPNHTGVLDDATANSLRAFQRLSTLPETGELDKITWRHLAKQFALSAHHAETQTLRNKI